MAGNESDGASSDGDEPKSYRTKFSQSWENMKELEHSASFRSIVGSPQIYCKHGRGCLQNALIGGMKNFCIGVGLKTVTALLRSLVSRRLPQFRSTARDTLYFALFLGSFSLGYKAVNCFLRKILKEENKLNAFVAGSLAGMSILWLDKSQRAAIATYLWVRSAKVTFDAASEQEWFPKWIHRFHHWDTGLLTLTACQILYCYIMKQDALPGDYLKFLLGAGRKDQRVIAGLRNVANREAMNAVDIKQYCDEKGIDFGALPALDANVPQTVLCDIMHPNASCWSHYLQYLAKHFFQYSVRFYVPLNIVSVLLFQRQRFMKNPGLSMYYLVKNCTYSSAFLAMYCGNAWLAQCVMRQLNICSGTSIWLFGGSLAGLSVLNEQRSRRMELALYCMSPMIQSAYACGVDWRVLPRVPNVEACMFSLAMGTLMMAHQHDGQMQPTLQMIMKGLMGIN